MKTETRKALCVAAYHAMAATTLIAEAVGDLNSGRIRLEAELERLGPEPDGQDELERALLGFTRGLMALQNAGRFLRSEAMLEWIADKSVGGQEVAERAKALVGGGS